MTIRILAVSDQIDPRIHSITLRQRMPDVKIVFGCGDLPSRYLEFLADVLERPVYFVLGNHMEEWTKDIQSGKTYDPMGCIKMDGKVVKDRETGLVIGGLPGSPKYSGEGGQQFSEFQMYRKIVRMLPAMIGHRIRDGRWLDVLVTHAPPRGINDRSDIAHRGFKSIRWFVATFKPKYHLHGHVHLYDRHENSSMVHEKTTVINVFPFKKIDLTLK